MSYKFTGENRHVSYILRPELYRIRLTHATFMLFWLIAYTLSWYVWDTIVAMCSESQLFKWCKTLTPIIQVTLVRFTCRHSILNPPLLLTIFYSYFLSMESNVGSAGFLAAATCMINLSTRFILTIDGKPLQKVNGIKATEQTIVNSRSL